MSIKFTSYPLDGICRLQMGKTPKRDKAEYWGEGFPWVSIADMKGKFIETTKEQITAKAIEESGCKMIRKGTLLLSFKLSIGKLAFAGTDLFTNEAIVALLIRDLNEVYPEYLYYVLKTLPLAGRNKAAKGSTLNTKSLKKIQVPIPEKYEDQVRIARILQKVDSLIQDRELSIQQIEEYQKSVFEKMFGNIGTNNKNWDLKTLPELAKKEKYAIKRGPFGGSLKKQIFVSKGYLVYEQFHAINDDFSLARYFITEEKYRELEMFKVVPGDLIISCSGVTLGRIAEIPKNALPGIINQALLKLSLDNEIIDNRFFKFVFRHSWIQGKLFGFSRGSGIPNFPSMSEVNALRFPTPPINLQKEFSSVIKTAEKLIVDCNESLVQLNNLLGKLNQKIFDGKIDLSKLDVSDILISFLRFIENTPPLEEEEKQTRRPRTTKVDNVTFTNYYEDDFATMMKNYFGKFHFRFKDIEEMFAEEEGGALTYFTTQELKRITEKAPKDIHTFIFDCVEKKNKNLKLNQFFYDALTDLSLKKIKLKAGNDFVLQQINNKQISREGLSGIYFQIVR